MKTWEIKVTEETGKISFKRSNTGFTAIELIGILDYMKDEIIRQIRGEAQFTIQSKATRIIDPECGASSSVIARIYDISEDDIVNEINKKADKYGFDRVKGA